MDGITVTGRGSVNGVPDTHTVSIGVAVTRPSVAEATAVASERTAALIAAFERADVAGSDKCRPPGYRVGPQWDHRMENPRLTGYRVDTTQMAAGRQEVAVSLTVTFAIGAS